jgi:hypothetical protein
MSEITTSKPNNRSSHFRRSFSSAAVVGSPSAPTSTFPFLSTGGNVRGRVISAWGDHNA